MGTRLEFQAILSSLTGVTKAYYQPPATLRMEYPCIVYKRDDENVNYASNGRYKDKMGYLVTVIDRDADSAIPRQVAELPYSSFSTYYTVDNLHHDVYRVYF